MRLVLLAVGRLKSGPERELFKRYMDRAEASGRSLGLGPIDVVEIDESRLGTAGQRKTAEADALRGRIPAGAAVSFLDERGRALDSRGFAGELARDRDGGAPAAVFVIGGPDGLDPAWTADSRTISFGPMTFPHQLARMLLAEQIYRATTILAGHPYHRG